MNLRGMTEANYRRDYNRGWEYGRRSYANLDHLELIGASEALYDGYSDRVEGRAKWATPTEKGN